VSLDGVGSGTGTGLGFNKLVELAGSFGAGVLGIGVGREESRSCTMSMRSTDVRVARSEFPGDGPGVACKRERRDG